MRPARRWQWLTRIGDFPFSSPVPRLTGRRVILRGARRSDCRAWIRLRAESRKQLEHWEPKWPKNDLTPAGFHARRRSAIEAARAGRAYHFLIFEAEHNRLTGGFSIYDIQTGASRNCMIGYWAGLAFRRQGYVGAALAAAAPFIFGTLGLQRITAACLTENIPSQKLLLKAGFSPEGRARAYMQIAGIRRDHLIFSLLHDDPRPQE